MKLLVHFIWGVNSSEVRVAPAIGIGQDFSRNITVKVYMLQARGVACRLILK